MTRDPRAFFALDLGAATVSAALLARIAGRWRLLGNLALPSGVTGDTVCRELVARACRADPKLAGAAGLDLTDLDEVPTVTVRSHPPRRLAVVAASERALAPLAAVAARRGWDVVGASVETRDPLEMSRLLLEAGIDAILAGAGDPPGGDERSALPELAALVAAVAERRPALTIVLAGALAHELERFGDVGSRPGEVLLGPAAGAGGGGLDELLGDLALPPDDARRSAATGVATLADVVGRRVEYLEIGHDAGLRAVADPTLGRDEQPLAWAVVAAAALVPQEPDDAVLDRVTAWSPLQMDRHRLRDRLRELRIVPWGDAAGEGAVVRLAAVRAALARLVQATSSLGASVAPDLLVAGGGAWSVAPGPVITLALADVVRRSGATQYAYDHARLLGPIGSIADPDERRAVIADLADDLLVPLGSVVTPAGLRAGRTAGKLAVHAGSGVTELDLVPGGLELVDLPPGQTAVAEFRFRDTVHLGGRGRHFAVDVAGGLGGLLVDLRDVPMRLPERQERRRELLEAWQASLWTGNDA
ncbi:MAG TPA: hypothetical protein VLA44_06990 [Clostridia bacterium]|nr:hypothetical protein [Clostridia bacterium]